MTGIMDLTDETFADQIAATQGGIVLFYKKLCPHCKNMEKVLEKFAVKSPETAILAIDSEACPRAMSAYGVERVPTLTVVKSGQIAAKKAGLMNPKELAAFYDEA